jgi:hypothetical protein
MRLKSSESEDIAQQHYEKRCVFKVISSEIR